LLQHGQVIQLLIAHSKTEIVGSRVYVLGEQQEWQQRVKAYTCKYK